MRSQRYSLVSTLSEKSLDLVHDDSQTDVSTGYYLPLNNQKRFTRKNNNSSVEKKKNKTQMDSDQDLSISTNRYLETPKISKEKTLTTFVRVSADLSNSRPKLNTIENKDIKSGSFKLQRNRPLATRKNNIETTVRISEEKHTSRISGASIDSRASRTGKSNNVAVLKTELEIKEKELMMLEDQKRRFRNNIQQLKRKENWLQQELNKKQTEIKHNKNEYEDAMKKLRKKAEDNEQANKILKQQNQKIKKQLDQSLREKKIIQKQLNIFVDKQVPKNIRELQSCRQISLTQTIEQLKIQLNKDKSDIQKEMELEISRLREQMIILRNQLKGFEIRNRLLEKKSSDAKRYFQAYTAIKADMKNIRMDLKDANEQCEMLRTENVRLKKQIKRLNISITAHKTERKISLSIINYNGKPHQQEQRQERGLTRVPSDAESINLSISACSKQE